MNRYTETEKACVETQGMMVYTERSRVMLDYIAGFSRLLTEFMGWGSFLAALLAGLALLLGKGRKFMGAAYLGYGAAFLVVRFAFLEFYFRWMPAIAIFLTLVSTLRDQYEDQVNGKRWWNL
jgi:hypothetical protein